VSSPKEVLSYWFPEGFDEANAETRRRQAKRWMAGGPEVDREITEPFASSPPSSSSNWVFPAS